MSKIPPFDPRQVPFEMADGHLPPVPAAHLHPEALGRRFNAPPAWEPEIRVEPRFMDRAPSAASVLVGLVTHARPTVLLTQRTVGLRSHAGQVAFPGGKSDTEDEDAVTTALREAQEEVGLHPSHVRVLGSLPHYTTGSGFVVTPVVALLEPGFVITPNPDEVAAVFEVPLDYLMNPAHHRRHTLQTPIGPRHWISMPYQDGAHERYIWGATAGMLRNLYRFLLPA
jgi:8-oxo-dGTP pyrophosphatase MutT (NUDIX family)